MWPRFSSDARGNALLATLAILVGLTILVMTYVLLASSESQIAGQDKRGTQAMYVAEAGVAEAMGRLDPNVGASSIVQSGGPTAGWGCYIVSADDASSADAVRATLASDGLDNDIDGNVDEANETWPEVLTVQNADSALAYPWVRVTYKTNGAGQVVRFGDGDLNPLTPDCENTVRGAPVYVITSTGDKGSAHKVIEVTAEHVPFPPIPSVLYTETTNMAFNGTQFEVNGYDHDLATGDSIPGNPTILGIATTGDPTEITDEFHAQQTNNVLGTGASPSVAQSPYDYDMVGYFSLYAGYADIVYEGDTMNPDTSGWGDQDSYHVIQVNGDLHLSGPVTGGGVLLVQGDLDISGQFTWYGAIICLGNCILTGGGQGVHVWGGMMVSNGVGYEDTFSGNAEFLYSSEAIAKINTLGPFRIAAWREI